MHHCDVPGQTPHREVCAVSGLVEGAKAEQRGGRLAKGGLLQHNRTSVSLQRSTESMTDIRCLPGTLQVACAASCMKHRPGSMFMLTSWPGGALLTIA